MQPTRAPYLETLASIRTHALPAWFDEAKLGIFIHWGLFSVPAYAPIRQGDMQEMLKHQPQEFFFTHQPYAEWYWNSLRLPGSPVNQYHQATYGQEYPYPAFAEAFNRQAAAWDAEAWTELFHQAGARYVVLVTKHHDGFLLWPSRSPHPRLPGYQAQRDIVGELSAAVRRQGLRMGTYYSSALDWSFTSQPIRSFADLATSGPTQPEYRAYVETHWGELIERYQTDILWSDIGYPPGYPLPKLMARFYNARPDGVVNDRWMQIPQGLRNRLGRALINHLVNLALRRGGMSQPSVPHCDFQTTEYTGFATAQAKKWEACRGVGNSFGYNQVETEADYQTGDQLIKLLVEIVSKNGNLLLNVGPRPDGSLPAPQVEALKRLGSWLSIHGEAIYATHPWQGAPTPPKIPAAGQPPVYYTAKGAALYAHLFEGDTPIDWRGGIALTLPSVSLAADGQATLLATGQSLAHEAVSTPEGKAATAIHLPGQALPAPVVVIKLNGVLPPR